MIHRVAPVVPNFSILRLMLKKLVPGQVINHHHQKDIQQQIMIITTMKAIKVNLITLIYLKKQTIIINNFFVS